MLEFEVLLLYPVIHPRTFQYVHVRDLGTADLITSVFRKNTLFMTMTSTGFGEIITITFISFMLFALSMLGTGDGKVAISS